MCAVADGTADGYVDFGTGLAPWDYLGALLICEEAGAEVTGMGGQALVSISTETRVRPLCAATPELLAELSTAVV